MFNATVHTKIRRKSLESPHCHGSFIGEPSSQVKTLEPTRRNNGKAPATQSLSGNYPSGSSDFRRGDNGRSELPTSHQVQSRVQARYQRHSIIRTVARNIFASYEQPTRRTNAAIANEEFGGYSDIGDPNYTCTKYGALMWYGERHRLNTKPIVPYFTLCCKDGVVELPLLKNPPSLLHELLMRRHPKSKHFIETIRAYNNMFSFTSMGGKIDHSINRGRGTYTFRMGGQNAHLIGSLLPNNSAPPKFCQLYIYDTEQELTHRKNTLSSTNPGQFDDGLISELQRMIDDHNPLAQSFRMARDMIKEGVGGQEVRLRLISGRKKDGRTYNLPTVSEVAALIVGDIDNTIDGRDIIVQEQGGNLQRISELHASYLALQYPFLFPRGEDGHRIGIPHSGKSIASPNASENSRDKLTLREWFSFRIQDRSADREPSTILMAGRLFQQFCVDGYTMIEAQRLAYLRFNQPKLRSENYKNLAGAVANGQTEPSADGIRYIIPSTFLGGRGYMRKTYQDTMTICKWCGYPDLFITFTCNPKWPEITRFVTNKGVKPEDRPDILTRVFKIKLEQLMRDFKELHIFGRTLGDDKFPEAADVDRIISAEIPDPFENPVLHEAVRDLMIHGPCGAANPNSPCMIDGICSKRFPKQFNERTTIDGDGYPMYRRRDNGVTIEKSGVRVHNGYVVPYNPDLLSKYRAHINVEWCNQARSIKYLFKYINKGYDRVTVSATHSSSPDQIDHIQEYYDCRYISPCEAVWRIFAFDIHYRTPPVFRLDYHLPNEQNVIFNDDDSIDEVVARSNSCRTKFSTWMEYNKKHSAVRELTYCLLGDDKEYIDAIIEASFWGTGFYLRNLFATLLLSDMQLNDAQLQNYALAEIEAWLQSNGSSLRKFDTLPFSDYNLNSEHANKLISDELSYDRDALRREHEILTSPMTSEQKSVYTQIMDAVENRNDVILLPRGHTAHSRFSIPINVDENSTCPGIKPGTDLAELLIRTKLIIWDEAPMVNRHYFEALDRSLRDIMRFSSSGDLEKPFGGKIIVFDGDFRQILHVVPKGSRQDIVYASISSSPLWRYCKVLKLTRNMRLEVGSSQSNTDEIRQFSEWILQVGDGLAGGPNDDVGDIEIPEELLIHSKSDPIAAIVESTYPSLNDHLGDPHYFKERAVLALTHDIVELVNKYVLSLIPNEERVYLSSDEISKDENNIATHDLYSTEFLNTIRCSGLPNHNIKLKVGAIVMLLRNIDQANGLCNGTRLVVTNLGDRVIGATVISGSNNGMRVYIPCITLTPSDTTKFPVRFDRRSQFPLTGLSRSIPNSGRCWRAHRRRHGASGSRGVSSIRGLVKVIVSVDRYPRWLGSREVPTL
ncbi:hypothetical protein RND81_10G137800 [Saponaria officinalis]|uniref:ATP-dependent DNA helicase n=1 Tax=Saponaria officinalis TaxID=3572 RepID=A0AAW1I312_SAPOF